MSEISFSKEPGYYLESDTVNFVLSPLVKNIQYSLNAGAPSISKYVAYDQSVPPVPFIAVTQDGKGNVVYDGGFPKFYNSSAPAVWNSPWTVMSLTGTVPTAIANPFYYDEFTDLGVTFDVGDKLIFDTWCDNINFRGGLDANIIDGVYRNLRNYPDGGGGNAILDQNGESLPGAKTQVASTWYTRTVDLTPVAGCTSVSWMMAMEMDTVGTYTFRIRNVRVVDTNGTIKAVLLGTQDAQYTSLRTADDVYGTPSSLLNGYNNLVKEVRTPLNQLSASFKYLYNTMNFIANPAKVAMGNRKVLVLGDALTAANYAIKSTVASGFNISLQRFAVVGNWEFTYKDPSNYPAAALDARLAELEQYCCVVMFSTVYTGGPITQACIDDLVLYREAGNGMVFITDHGPILSTIQAAIANTTGFFVAANKVVTNFGTWFSGDYNRSPVNVGFLRTNYGDHPLYDGLSNDESIYAGGSESRVNVAITPSYLPGAVPSFTLVDGRNTIQAAAELLDGSIETLRVYFYVVAFKITFSDGIVTRDNGQILDIGVLNRTPIDVAFVGESDVLVQGVVYKGGVRVGALTFNPATGVNTHTWDNAGAGAVKVLDGEQFKVTLSSPIEFDATLTIKRFQPMLDDEIRSSNVLKRLRQFKPALTDIIRMKTIIADIGGQVPYLGLKPVPSLAMNLKMVTEYFNDQGLASIVLPNAAVMAYSTGRTWPATGDYALWAPLNPVTGQAIDFTYLAYSPVYGSESVPANFKLDYYANLFLAAGTYRMFSHADDIFEFYIDGVLKANHTARGQTDIVIAEGRYYALKVSNTNVPGGTPSHWTCALVDLTTGVVVMRPEPGVWKTQEYSAV